ncbi:MAG: symmetrical bis(5'-nucleosyl)-tetraphosphatase [Rhodocyclaceae bacterium]|nr:symmetrical bis(5'-nucleosyl)-tetraphosphatase [Rhodocyclaceae bacterium]
MATYAIGDIQGCYDELCGLMERVRFDPSQDRLWLVGDLVNRGPASLEVLRLVRGMGDAAIVVLGNHDLYLLMVAAGFRKRGKDDTLGPVLDAPDRGELLDWLAGRPLLHLEGERVLVHAGLPPQWSAPRARALAGEVEAALRGPDRDRFLSQLQGNRPAAWCDDQGGQDRLRYIVNALTRMRFCSPEGRLEFDAKGPPAMAPDGYLPWFDLPVRAAAAQTIVCGHWSALGFRRQAGLLALDTGCLWGGELTAVRLEDGLVFREPARTRRTRN